MSDGADDHALPPPATLPGVAAVGAPRRVRHELQWSARLPDGGAALLAQLVPELAADPALRRRYVQECERMAALPPTSLAPTLATGPTPDPRDPTAAPPWRLRLDPPGDDLAALFARAAPLPVDRALALAAALADAVHGVHLAGVVLRDLEPARVRLGGGDRSTLLDVGAARFAILSSRTASSMLLEASPYAAPEHLRTTLVDVRADVYAVAAIAWHALTGAPPFGDAHAVLGGRRPPLGPLPDAVPPAIAAALAAALDEAIDRRPAGAAVLAAILRGERGLDEVALERVACQACGAPLRIGLRLCLACGKEAICFRHIVDYRDARAVVLTAAREDEAFDRTLRGVLADVSARPERPLAFLVGHTRMYDKEERAAAVQLPAMVLSDLSPEVAEDLAGRMRAAGFKVKTRKAYPLGSNKAVRNSIRVAGWTGLVGGVTFVATGAAIVGGALVLGSIATLIGGAIANHRGRHAHAPALARLRPAPAALPASDPLVARLAATLGERIAPDLRERVADLALVTQRLVDRRALRPTEEDALAPIAALVELAAGEIAALVALDRELADLDEGALVRALAAGRARGESETAQGTLLAGLDQLRRLEDRRAAGMRRLLAVADLLRRAALIAAGSDDAGDEAHLYREARAELDAERGSD